MQNKIIQLYNGLRILKSDLSINDLNYIRNTFYVRDDVDIELSKKFYYEDTSYLYIPHLSLNINGIYNIINQYQFNIIDKNNSYFNKTKLKGSMKIQPRNEIQTNAIEFLLNSSKDNKSLFLSPGTGKTALSIMYFIKKKIKPLIIVPDMNLLNQWVNAILEFTTLKEEDIFSFEHGSASFNKKDFNNNKRVYVCCIKTLSSMISKNEDINSLLQLDTYIKEMKIDLKIFDECHLNLHSIYKTLTWFPTRENLFLSGTMNRRLVKENYIHPSIVEPNECIESVEYDIIPNLMSLFYNTNPTIGNVRYCQEFNIRTGFDYNKYFNNYLLSTKHIDKQNTYFQMIENMCHYYININSNKAYNKMIIIGYTIKFLDCLYDVLTKDNKYRVKRMYSKYKEKPEDESFDIIIGTNKMLTAGFDHKSLNVMISTFMNTSKHNVKQLIGRICRSAPNKSFAQYICLVDKGFSMQNAYFKKHETICSVELSKKESLSFKKIDTKFKW